MKDLKTSELLDKWETCEDDKEKTAIRDELYERGPFKEMAGVIESLSSALKYLETISTDHEHNTAGAVVVRVKEPKQE